jgi:hypothetical protein
MAHRSGMHECVKCFVRRLPEEFIARQRGREYTSTVCVGCRREAHRISARKHHHGNPERAKAKRAARYAKHREHDAAVTRARKVEIILENTAKSVTAESKICSKCKKLRAGVELKRKLSSLDGLGSWCKPCESAASLLRYRNNREECNRKSLERYHTDKEKYAASNKAWMRINQDRRRAYARAYCEKNKDRLRRARAERHAKNRPQRNDCSRRWRKANPEKAIQYRHARRARIAGQGGKYTTDDIKRILLAQHGRCAICRVKLQKLFRDHIVPIHRGGSNQARNIQLTCRPCNAAKHSKDPITFMQERGFLL